MGSHHPSEARRLVGPLSGLWVMGTLLDLWVETNLVPKLWCLTVNLLLVRMVWYGFWGTVC